MPPSTVLEPPNGRAAFDYRALRGDGGEVHGRAWATGELELDRLLHAEGLTLVEARPSRAERGAASMKLKTHELVGFTNQLATMIQAGIPLLQCLQHLEKHSRTKAARDVLASVLRLIEGGSSLSEALGEHSSVFSPTYVAMVRSGELSASLPEVLRRQGKYMDWLHDVRATAKQALVYPAALCIAITGLVVILITFLIPSLVGMFPGGEEDLPTQTKFVMAISDFLVGNWQAIVASLLLGAVLFALLLRVPRTRIVLSRAVLRLPRLGALLRMLSIARFATTAAALHSSGCEIVSTLQIAGDSCGNTYLQSCFARAIEHVRGGESISDSLAKVGKLDPYLIQLTAVGETSGRLGECLEHLADGYNTEVPRAVKWTLGLIEPTVLIGGGLLVTGLLLSALLPIFKLYETLG